MDSIAAATNPDSVEALTEERTASSRSDAVQAGWRNIKSFFSRKLPWQPMLEQSRNRTAKESERPAHRGTVLGPSNILPLPLVLNPGLVLAVFSLRAPEIGDVN